MEIKVVTPESDYTFRLIHGYVALHLFIEGRTGTTQFTFQSLDSDFITVQYYYVLGMLAGMLTPKMSETNLLNLISQQLTERILKNWTTTELD